MIKIKRNSAAYLLLKRLVDLGGVAVRAQLASGMKSRAFYHAMESLRCRFLIDESGAEIKATLIGKEQVAEFESVASAVVSAPLQMALPRVPKPFTPLRMSCFPVPFRAGADEHKLIPSLMGELRKLPSGEVIN